jgi:D-glycero-D-manno-heptose 1,7-bisphosphate phosphatase
LELQAVREKNFKKHRFFVYFCSAMAKKNFLKAFQEAPAGTFTLFLDRDGVINLPPENSYATRRDEFLLAPGVPEALAVLGRMMGRICVVTNQQGVGKGLMTEADLLDIHMFMREQIAAAGGRIDAVYYCPHLAQEGCSCRKPGIGMALKAQQDFPEIDFSRSLMAGDAVRDILFGQKAGMYSAWISHEDFPEGEAAPDLHFPDLPSLAQWLSQLRS